MTLTAEKFHTIYRELLGKLLMACTAKPRGKLTRELIGVTLELTDSRNNVLISPTRNLNYRFMVMEWLWIFSGSDELEPVARVNSQIRKFSDDGLTLSGAYGPRWLRQFPAALDLLRRDPDTRRAVISFWRHDRDLVRNTNDVPCTLTLQLLLRAGALNAVVNMRSSDAMLGIPYDVFNFTMLLNYAASVIGVVPGSLILNLGSSHLYEEHARLAFEILNENDTATLRSPLLPVLYPEQVTYLHQVVHGRVNALTALPATWHDYLNAALGPSKQNALMLLTEVLSGKNH